MTTHERATMAAEDLEKLEALVLAADQVRLRAAEFIAAVSGNAVEWESAAHAVWDVDDANKAFVKAAWRYDQAHLLSDRLPGLYRSPSYALGSDEPA